MFAKKAGSLLDEHQPDSSTSSSSPWSNFFSKLRTLLPFVWPAKAPSLQIRVLMCFLLLGAGRVANVYVPVLYKMLGKNRSNWQLKVHHISPLPKCINL